MKLTEIVVATNATSSDPEKVEVLVVPRAFALVQPFPSNWDELLPPSVRPKATAALHLRSETLMSCSSPSAITGHVFKTHIVARDKSGTELARATVAATIPAPGAASPYPPVGAITEYPVVVEELVGFTTEAIVPSPFGFSFDWRAVYSNLGTSLFQISIRTPALLCAWPYETTITVTWEHDLPDTTFTSNPRSVYAYQREVPHVTMSSLTPFPNAQQCLVNEYTDLAYDPAAPFSSDSFLTEVDFLMRDGGPGNEASWTKQSVPVYEPGEIGVSRTARKTFHPAARLRGFASAIIAREPLGGEALLLQVQDTDGAAPFQTCALVPLEGGKLARFGRGSGFDGVRVGWSGYNLFASVSSAWQEEDGVFPLLVKRTPGGVWELVRFSYDNSTPGTIDFSLYPQMAIVFSDPDIIWAHVAKTPGGGAVAVGLRHTLTVALGGAIDAESERQWLFKRSPDRETWPPDEEATVILQPNAGDITPPTIEYQDGLLVVSNNNTVRSSRQLGAEGTWHAGALG